MSADPRVVIWRSAMLPGSETFVRDHGAALHRWSPAYLGAVRVDSPLAADTDRIAFPDARSFLRLRLTGRSPRLDHALRELRPDLVHAHFGGDAWLVSGAAAGLGVPLVITVHGHDVTRQPAAAGLRGLRYRRNLRTAFRRAALILAVSEHIRTRAHACGADPAKVRVHHTGIPLPSDEPAVPKRWDVAFVGRLVAKKGVADLLTALSATPARAVIIGTGPLEGPLRRQAAELGVDATFLGALPHAEALSHVRASRIFAAPSRTAPDGDSEGLPTTILEASALGVPVVATRHSGIPEAVRHLETGLLCAEGDSAALAAHIGRLLTDDALRARLGANGRAHVTEGFDLSRQSRRLEAHYDDVAGRVSAGR
ncbi:glycosyltransferase [Couchioplanes caeruleus]|uniref:Glycosyl transferase family 1 n=2 Tax=Couchioplanes caeruleus TaxID=56438 RepID=A0A1K0F9G9_9ACTN|nr:glycosyltransferase [Couchioplanes caeruleus]OJF09501.1 glycosyl transferase family 1 [Couchioplanes caeruleus subsp. caeruleus]ROP33774.1 glycosyltransferase involved in cell wall biosynthesis [Couchioplanes caeruleus]